MEQNLIVSWIDKDLAEPQLKLMSINLLTFGFLVKAAKRDSKDSLIQLSLGRDFKDQEGSVNTTGLLTINVSIDNDVGVTSLQLKKRNMLHLQGSRQPMRFMIPFEGTLYNPKFFYLCKEESCMNNAIMEDQFMGRKYQLAKRDRNMSLIEVSFNQEHQIIETLSFNGS